MGGGRPCFEDLPEFCVLEILRRCAGTDILSFQAVSHWALLIGKIPSLWKGKLEEDYNVVLPQNVAGNYGALQRLYRTIFDRTSNELLHFRGVLTDGGVQEGRTMFWVDNMFARKPTLTYCSDILERDVRCLGIHRADRAPWDYSIQQLDFDGKRSVMYDERLLKEVHCGSASKDGDTSMIVTQQIIIGRMGDISCPVSCGLVLLGDLSSAAGHPDKDAARELYSAAGSDMVDTLSGMKDLDMILAACMRHEIAPPLLVGAKDMGEWVEFGVSTEPSRELQPIAWFRFFSKDENVEGSQEKWENMKRDFEELGTVCRFPKCVTPDIENAAALEPSEELLNDDYGDLDPLPMASDEVHLWQEAISVFNATHRFMLGREHMTIDLEQPRAGNLACAVLISCENWMAQTWVRGGPNVDVNFMYMVGKELSLAKIAEYDDVVDEVSISDNNDENCEPETSPVGQDNAGDVEAVDELVSRIDRIWFGHQK